MAVSQTTLPSQPEKQRLPKIMYLIEHHASIKTGVEVKPGEQVNILARKGDWAVTKTLANKVIWIPLTKLASFAPGVPVPPPAQDADWAGERAPQDYGGNWMGEKLSLSFDEIFQEPIRLGWVKEASMILYAPESEGMWERITSAVSRNGSIALSGVSNSISQKDQRFFMFEKNNEVEKYFVPINDSDVKVAGTPDNIELQYDVRNRYDNEIIALITGWLRFFNAREKKDHRLGVSMVNRRVVGIERSRKREGDLLLFRFEIRMKDGTAKSFYCTVAPKFPGER